VPHSDSGRPLLLPATQFAHDGVSDHAEVAFHVMRVLRPDPRHGAAASRLTPTRHVRRGGLPRRFRSSTLRACGCGGEEQRNSR